MLDQLSEQSFLPYLNQTFQLQIEAAETLDLELIEVSGLTCSDAEAKRKPFALILRGSGEQVLEQGTVHLEHTEMGGLDLFLVPIGPDEKGMRYEVVFN